MRKAFVSPTKEQPQHLKSFSLEAHGAFHPEGDVSEMSTKKHARFAAPHSSSEGEATRLELERQLSVSLAAQTELDQRIAQLTEDLALKSSLLEQAEASEANAVEEKRRGRLELVDMKSKLKSREAKLDELLLSFDQQTERHEEELANVRAKLGAKESKLEAKKSKLEAKESELEAKKSELKANESRLKAKESKLKAKESELEALRLRLADAESGLTKSKAETLRWAKDATGSVNRDEDQGTRRLMERMRAIEAQIASKRWNEKGIEDMECSNEKSIDEMEYGNEG